MKSPCRTATILITTKDRAGLFAQALQSALDQDFPCEIVVVDDASGDNTSQVAHKLCPHATILRNDLAVGIIAARNQGFEHATGDVVFTLDDDAVFSSRELVSSVMAEFQLPFVGAVTIPLIDHLTDGSTHQRLPIEEPAEDFLCVPIFSGGANAIRKDLFEACGGYSGFVRQGEERGVALKMLDAGMIVRVASRYHIDHFPQPRVGDRSDILYWSARNHFQFGWNFVPMLKLPGFVVVTVLKQIKNGICKRKPIQPLAAMCAAAGDFWRTRKQRSPSSTSAYAAFQELLNRKVLRLSEVRAILKKNGKELATC
jgi:glycosyltransferase involved in cell wall biosynthesis